MLIWWRVKTTRHQILILYNFNCRNYCAYNVCILHCNRLLLRRKGRTVRAVIAIVIGVGLLVWYASVTAKREIQPNEYEISTAVAEIKQAGFTPKNSEPPEPHLFTKTITLPVTWKGPQGETCDGEVEYNLTDKVVILTVTNGRKSVSNPDLSTLPC